LCTYSLTKFDMTTPTTQEILEVMRNKNYRIYEQDTKNYNLNLIGIRTATNIPNSFDDIIIAMWKFHGNWNMLSFGATTDPGLYWLEHPENPAGTAIVKEGQYPKLWQIGKHRGKYKALVQLNKVTVIRDFNRNKKLDYVSGKETTGIYGINCHRANEFRKSTSVDKWSAGCQVIADPNDFKVLMTMCDEGAKNWGNSFGYTLLNEKDFG
jgi:hypothetical protein